MSDINVTDLFAGLFGRKTEDTPATPQERAASLIESYQLDESVNKPLVEKLAVFEEAADTAKTNSNAEIEAAQKAIEDAQTAQKQAQDVVLAAKAVGLRMVTLSKEVKSAKEKAEEAKTKAQAEVEALAKSTEDAKTLGNALLNGLTDSRLDVETILNLTQEEVENLFGKGEVTSV